MIHLHKQATTTPKVRAAIQASVEPASALAERFGTTEQTIYKWKHRDTVHDRSHTPHRLQTTLSPAQEAVAVVLRKTLLVSIDDLLALAIGLEPMAPSMARCGSFSTRRSRALGLTGVCGGMGLAICAICRRKAPDRSTRRSRPMSPAICTWTSSICLKWLTKRPAATCLWRLIGRPAGCSSASTNPRPPPMRDACLTRPGTRLPDAHPHHTYGQREGIHRPPVRPAQTQGHRQARI